MSKLTRWSRRAKSFQALALRSKIVLACAEGLDNSVVAERVGCEAHTVSKWRRRFIERRLEGLGDEQRPGRPRTISVDQIEDVIVATLESTPPNATHWTRSKMAERTGLSKSTIGKVWKNLGLKPHLVDHFKLSTDPLFIDKLYDVVGLYLNPPEAVVVLCVDEKSKMQALQRSQSAFPMMPGMPERRTHDYVRHGTTTLFAATDVADGTVITSLRRKHRAIEFKKFLTEIDAEVPGGLDIHLICNNYGTHKHPLIKTWLEAHPRVKLHLTPTYSSWLILVERFFGYVTPICLQCSDRRSVHALEADVRKWVEAWNEDPKVFVWTKIAEQILGSLGRLMQRISNPLAPDFAPNCPGLVRMGQPASSPSGSALTGAMKDSPLPGAGLVVAPRLGP